MENTDNLAPSKNQCIQGTSQDRFDAKIMEKLIEKDKLLIFKKTSCLHIAKDNYKEARNKVQKFICKKKKVYSKRKLTENISKPKEL